MYCRNSTQSYIIASAALFTRKWSATEVVKPEGSALHQPEHSQFVNRTNSASKTGDKDEMIMSQD